MCVYRKVFVFKPISYQSNILVGYKLSFTKSLNGSYFEIRDQDLQLREGLGRALTWRTPPSPLWWGKG